jgi:hypothetical protein
MFAPLIHFYPGAAEPPAVTAAGHYCPASPAAFTRCPGPPHFDSRSIGLATSSLPDVHLILDPKRQRWSQLPDGHWLGVQTDPTPDPSLWLRPDALPGIPVTLGDRQLWILPRCNPAVPHGHPTQRGEIFSFVQGGEGLAVVAALEDDSYPIHELVIHLANLRAGVKFDLPTATASERLGAACRAAYGFINHHGYLENGLPLDYGDGAAEVLDAMLHPDRTGSTDLRRGIQEGDLSRAYIEWLSQQMLHCIPCIFADLDGRRTGDSKMRGLLCHSLRVGIIGLWGICKVEPEDILLTLM